ncbi:MAG: helix-turn-helix domain-containing protein [Pseudomonadota bacterium]
MDSKHIYFFVADGFQPLDLAGPVAVFATANTYAPDAYTIRTLGLDGGIVTPISGPRALPDHSIHAVDSPHTMVLVGGAGMRDLDLKAPDYAQLKRLCNNAERVVTICTGAFVAGQLGLLDGRQTITHWRYQDELAARFPGAQVVEDQLYSKDASLWCSAGVTAGIDTCLAVVREDCGESIAGNVARHLVVSLQRPGGGAQFNDAIKAQVVRDTRLGAVVHWIQQHLKDNLTLQVIAENNNMSERHLQRRFKACFGVTVTKFVERLRVERAKQILSVSHASIASAANSVGFKSSDSFRRAFERQTGVSPNLYIKRFINE